MIWRSIVIAAVATLLCTGPARAQAPSGRFELGIGPVWIGRASFEPRDANETTGTGGTFRLFSSSTELAAVSGFEAQLGARVCQNIEAEAFASYTKPELRTRIEFDAETSNAPLTATVSVQQFVIGGAGVWYPRVRGVGDRLRVFVRGGAGYLRQLEDGGTLVVTGRIYEVGGGVKFLFTSRASGWSKGVGARVDARASARRKGVTTDDRVHVSPAVGASLFVRF